MNNRTTVNHEARQKIAEIAEDMQLDRCEIGRFDKRKFHGCWGEAHAPAHRHPRVWYRSQPKDALWAYNQWLAACQWCHQVFDDRSKTTQKEADTIFLELRGTDVYEDREAERLAAGTNGPKHLRQR